eukprot:XP_028348819.1 uncharacterized protein LOC114486732 [Physeter catodon]
MAFICIVNTSPFTGYGTGVVICWGLQFWCGAQVEIRQRPLSENTSSECPFSETQRPSLAVPPCTTSGLLWSSHKLFFVWISSCKETLPTSARSNYIYLPLFLSLTHRKSSMTFTVDPPYPQSCILEFNQLLIVFSEKNLRVNGSMQFKPVLFRDKLYNPEGDSETIRAANPTTGPGGQGCFLLGFGGLDPLLVFSRPKCGP